MGKRLGEVRQRLLRLAGLGVEGTQRLPRLADQLVDNIEAFVAGTPRNVVT